jgi:hypothetical protein
MRRRGGNLIVPGVEELDSCGPFRAFSATRRDEALHREEPSAYDAS